MERCEILLEIIKDYDARGEPLWPSKLATLPQVTQAMAYVVAYRHLAILEERGEIITSKVKQRLDKKTNTLVDKKEKPIMVGGKRDLTSCEYARHEYAKKRTWDPNKKLIFIEELASMNNEEKDELFAVLHSIDDRLGELIEGVQGQKKKQPTKAEQIEKREVKA